MAKGYDRNRRADYKKDDDKKSVDELLELVKVQISYLKDAYFSIVIKAFYCKHQVLSYHSFIP